MKDIHCVRRYERTCYGLFSEATRGICGLSCIMMDDGTEQNICAKGYFASMNGCSRIPERGVERLCMPRNISMMTMMR